MDSQRTIRYILSLVVIAVFLLHSAGKLQIRLLDSLENQAYDARMRLLPPASDEQHVAIVTVDEKSLAAIGRWPWRRDTIATIVDNLFNHYRIKAMGFDVVFAEADQDAREMPGTLLTGASEAATPSRRDHRFAQSLDDRRTVLGYVFGSGTRKGSLPDPVALLDSAAVERFAFIRTESFTANLDVLQANAHSGGFFDNPLIDDDGVSRRMPLLQQHENGLYESLSLALVRSALDSARLELVVGFSSTDRQHALLEWLKIDGRVIPVDERAGVLIPYPAALQSIRHIPAIDVLNMKADVDALAGKIVLFGTTAPGLMDLHTTPVRAAFPGIEIHANVIQGILDQSIMHRPGYMKAAEFASILILGIVLALALTHLGPAWGLISTAASALLLIAVNLALWSELQLAASIAAPLVFVFFMYLLHMTCGLIAETRSKRKLARLLGQYVPPEIARRWSTQTDTAQLGGEVREMSVLFTDIHDYAAIAESMAPEELTRLINAIFHPITEEIQRFSGTLDKYMGDAVMAFWGAPADDTQHAQHAVEAAMSIVRRIDQLNPSLQAQAWPAISIGIGISSGAMNVGNKGSSLRADYTVVGDAVNLGSRLEALTRIYGVDIIASENTRAAAPGIVFRELDRVIVKGKEQPVVIYEPLGKAPAIDEPVRTALARFHSVLDHYRNRRWDDAERLLRDLVLTDPQRRLYAIYLDRIARFRQHPPPDDWDGTFMHTSK